MIDFSESEYAQARRLVWENQKPSASFLQCSMRDCPYFMALNMLNRMERENLVSASNYVGKREILNTNSDAWLT